MRHSNSKVHTNSIHINLSGNCGTCITIKIKSVTIVRTFHVLNEFFNFSINIFHTLQLYERQDKIIRYSTYPYSNNIFTFEFLFLIQRLDHRYLLITGQNISMLSIIDYQNDLSYNFNCTQLDENVARRTNGILINLNGILFKERYLKTNHVV